MKMETQAAVDPEAPEAIMLPVGIDPKTPVGQLTQDDLIRIAASVRGALRWSKVSARKKKAHSKMMVDAKFKETTPEQRSAMAKKAVRARWAKVKKEKES